MCPGATPDVLAHLAGPMHSAILSGKLGKKCQFAGDSAFPNDYEHPSFLIPFARYDLRDGKNVTITTFTCLNCESTLNVVSAC